MNAKPLLAIASLALLAAASGARADEADGSQYAIQFEGTRTRAEVQAEAVTTARTHGTEPAGSRVIAAPAKSSVDVQALRAATVQSVRNGSIPSGEMTY